MHEALDIWKKLFTRPVSGFSHITINTRMGIPILIILVLTIISAIPLIPVMSSETHIAAQLKFSKGILDSLGLPEDNISPQVIGTQNPFTLFLYTISTFTGEIFYMAIKILSGVLPLFIVGLFLKQKIFIKHYITLFIFIAVIFVVDAFVKNIFILLSDYTTAFQNAKTLEDIGMATTAQTSITVFMDIKTMGILTYLTLDYFTDIFHIIFWVYIFFAIRGTWETDLRSAITGVVAFIMLGYLAVVVPQLLFS
ncbi:MAG: hypothetical protein JW904_06305 [Spirochaetales bacterium]|nr:hypothetical protein [Spirochaetales bacterium]